MLDKCSLNLSTNLGFLTLTGGFRVQSSPDAFSCLQFLASTQWFLGVSRVDTAPKLCVAAEKILLKSWAQYVGEITAWKAVLLTASF